MIYVHILIYILLHVEVGLFSSTIELTKSQMFRIHDVIYFVPRCKLVIIKTNHSGYRTLINDVS